MQNPKYITADDSSIVLERADGTLRIVDRDGPTDLFARAQAGAFGPVLPFDPASDVTPTPKPVKAVSRLQAKAALLQMGLLDQVETLMAGMDAMTRLAWTEAVEFRRSSPLLNSLAPYLTWPDGAALAEADLDDLFNLAQTIEV
jgi:hypothetical protein